VEGVEVFLSDHARGVSGKLVHHYRLDRGVLVNKNDYEATN